MATRKGKKITGGKYIKSRKKKRSEVPGQKRVVKVGEEKRKSSRVRGGKKKTFLLKSQTINLLVKDKTKKAKIKNVLETPSNRFFARQNILTKGTIIDTDLGKARITNRPTQEGSVNGILIE
jgi:small subunit ribosomal protein S8e